MRCRFALLTLLGAIAACDAHPPGKASLPPAAREKEAAPALSQQQVYERSEQCGKTSRDQFRRDWKDGGVPTADGKMTAGFTNHYNAKLNTCFYLLTVSHSADSTLRVMLFDINDGEQYGEYLGPAASGSSTGLPTTCRIEGMYCASRREWEVLVVPYMED